MICGYTSNIFYNGGHFYNGASPNDVAANGVPENPYFAQSFAPAYGDANSFNYPLALERVFLAAGQALDGDEPGPAPP